MSYSWYGRFPRPPAPAALALVFRSCDPEVRTTLGDVRRADSGGIPFVLRDPGGEDDLLSNLPGRFLNVYVPGKSAAGIEVSWDGEKGLRIRCLALASDEDYDLALAAVSRWMRADKVAFKDEENFDVELDKIVQTYGPDFRKGQQDGGCAGLAMRVEKAPRHQWVAVQTPVRALFADAAVLKRFKRKTLAEELIAHLKRLVWLGSGPGVSGVACPDKVNVNADGKTYVAEIGVLGKPTILSDPFADGYTILSVPDVPERLIMRWDDLVEVLKGRVEWLDGRQMLVPTMNDSQISKVFNAASKKAEVMYRLE